jgi:hypothetical protein
LERAGLFAVGRLLEEVHENDCVALGQWEVTVSDMDDDMRGLYLCLLTATVTLTGLLDNE